MIRNCRADRQQGETSTMNFAKQEPCRSDKAAFFTRARPRPAAARPCAGPRGLLRAVPCPRERGPACPSWGSHLPRRHALVLPSSKSQHLQLQIQEVEDGAIGGSYRFLLLAVSSCLAGSKFGLAVGICAPTCLRHCFNSLCRSSTIFGLVDARFFVSPRSSLRL